MREQDANGDSDLWDFALGQGAAEGPGSPRPQSPKRALARLSVDIEARPPSMRSANLQ